MPRYTVRTPIPKRVYTYAECDEMLCAKGAPAPRSWADGQISVRAHGNMFLSTDDTSPHFFLDYYSTDYDKRWRLATIRRTTGGSTCYELDIVDRLRRPSKKRYREEPAGLKTWRDFAERLTPYVRPNRPGAWELEQPHRYVIRDGEPPKRIHHDGHVMNLFFSALPVTCTEPTRREWVQRYVDKVPPEFLLRYRRFAARLHRELGDLCEAVRLAPRRMWAVGDGPVLCVAPRGVEGVKQTLLVLEMCQHDDYSRRWFHADGDYTRRHIVVRGVEQHDHPTWYRPPKFFTYLGSAPAKNTFIWPCANDAIVGIREWLMGQLHIPGL